MYLQFIKKLYMLEFMLSFLGNGEKKETERKSQT